MIELQNISKKYNVENNTIIALNNINLKIKEGEFAVLMGPSGSGKSTLMHIIGGLLKPDIGKVLIKEEDVSKYSDIKLSEFRNKNIGFVFQNFNLQPYYTALENIELPLIFSGIKEKVRRKKAENLLKELNLLHRKNHRPSQMSGGEIQRVSIARALINDSKIILADEPTGNIDRDTTVSIIENLQFINKKYNVTVVVVTHDIFFKEFTDNIINIIDGKINDKQL